MSKALLIKFKNGYDAATLHTLAKVTIDFSLHPIDEGIVCTAALASSSCNSVLANAANPPKNESPPLWSTCARLIPRTAYADFGLWEDRLG
eukprot:22429-Pleurochrysis_carterae.AAC.3